MESNVKSMIENNMKSMENNMKQMESNMKSMMDLLKEIASNRQPDPQIPQTVDHLSE